MKKLVQFGAGNIGRGFIAELFTQSGYEVVFVDIDPQLIDELNKRKSYTLEIAEKPSRKILIKNVRAVDGKNINVVADEILGADIIATAVGVNVLKNICKALGEGIRARADNHIARPVNIIICENLLHAGKILKNYLEIILDKKYLDYLNRNVGFVETVIGRMIPVVPEETKKNDPLYVMAEAYNMLPVAKSGFIGEIPEIKNLIPSGNFESYEERKLFMHNLGHSVLSYIGYLKGYKYIYEAVGDVEINRILKGALKEAGDAIIKKHGLSGREIDDYANDLLRRFANVALGDTVVRVARDPVRKLGPDDRMIGAMNLAVKQGIKPENIITTTACALLFDYAGDEKAVEVMKMIKDKGAESVIEGICGLKRNDELAAEIIKKYNELKLKYKK